MEKTILNFNEAAEYLSVTKGFLYKLTSTHRVPFYKPCGKKVFFRKSELDKWLEAGRVATDEELKGGEL